MKNFTNNFKQFTSRLSARWLIMALMMLVGTSSAWAATIYVAGTMTNWNTGAKAMSGSGTVSVEFQLTAGTYEYRIVDDQQKDGTKPNNWHWVKTSPSSSSGVTSISNFTNKTESNVSFTLASSASKYTVVIYYNTSTYTTYVKATLPATTYTISYDANGGSGAPAAQTKTEGEDLTLSSTVPTRTGYIFTGWNTAANGSGTEYASGDSYTANAAATLYAQWCAPSATLSSANYDAVNNEIDLSGSIVTCGKELFYGFLWKNKEDANWNTANAISGTGGNNNKTKENKEFAHSWNGFTPGTTYEFTAYALDATTNPYTWYFSTGENNVIEVSTCVTVVEPAVTMSPAGGEVCQGSPVTLTLTTRQSGVVYKIGNEEIFKNTTTHSFVPETNSVTVTASSTNACAGTNDKTKTFSISIKSLPEAPTFESNSMTVCEGEPFSLPTPTNLKVGTEDCIWSVGGKTTTGSQPGISEETVYAAVKNDGCPSPSVEFTVNVTPKPTITASKTSCAPYEEITLRSAAGAGTTWSADGGMLSATSGESVTFKAAPGTPYTVTAYANDCTDSETITVECAEEDCGNIGSNNSIIITCDPGTYTGDLYCYIFGATTPKGWSECKGTKTNGIWKWEFNNINEGDHSLIFHSNSKSNGKDCKTGDLNHKLQRGYQYDYALNGVNSKWCNEPHPTIDPVSGKKLQTITNPTVTTVSAEQKEGEAAVVIKGFLQATGCADITKYGYQYRVQGSGDFTDVLENGSKNRCDEWTMECSDLEFGVTYEFRAMATNSSKEGTGDVIEVTVEGQSTPVVIKAVRNDKTVNESHWADFVALYVQEDGITAADAKEVKNYTWEYSTDGTNWSTNFTGYVLGGASATVGVTNGNAKCNNIRPTKTGNYRVKVTYDNTNEQYSNIITITSDGFKLKYPKYGQNAGSDFAFEAASRTIPVFVVKTTENFPDCPASGMPSQDVEGQKAKKSVDVKIFENGNVVYDRKARMNYRGSSSLNFRKKSYAFCTGKEKTKNSKGDVDTGKENLFGLSNGAKDKDWVLYAAMPDPSMMRNRLIFDTYAQMTGKWGVNSMFVELIIDDEYMGVYVLMDKITNNEKRVYVGTYGDDEKKDYNGGFILKFDKTDVTDRFEDENSEKRNTFTTEKTGKSGIGSYGATFDQRFEIEYPEMEDMGTEKWVEFVNDNVKGKIEAFENALEAGNYTEVRKLIDYESWADWFIISEFAKNVDAYRASCFFVYNGDKIEARPLWDQELSFNNTATTVGNGKGCNSPDGLLIQNSGVYSDDFPAPFWFIGHTDENKSSTITGGLLNDPCFVTMVKNRYKDHLNNALSNGQLTEKISDYQEELTDAAKTRETNTWRPSSGEITACTGGGTGYTNISESISIGTMTDWITNRPAELTTALDALTGSSINISIEPSFVETYPWEPFTLTVDAPEGYEYEMEFTKEGADATGNMVIEKGGDIYTVKIKRPAGTLDQVFETVPYLATATLKVADDGCGGMTTPEANVNIRLNDRAEECPQPSLK